MTRPSLESIISRHIEAHGRPISQTLTVEGAAATAGVCKDRVREALAVLVAGGYVAIDVEGTPGRRCTKWHRSVKPYRDN